MKKCSKCKQEKELINFGKDKKQCDGLNRVCKQCRQTFSKEHSKTLYEYNKVWKENNVEKRKEYMKEYMKKYREINNIKYKEYFLKYKEKNYEKLIKYYKKYYQLNKEKRKKNYQNKKNQNQIITIRSGTLKIL